MSPLTKQQMEDLWEKIESKIWESLQEWKVRLEQHTVPSPETEKRLISLEKKSESYLKWRVFAFLSIVFFAICGYMLEELGDVTKDVQATKLQVAEIHGMLFKSTENVTQILDEKKNIRSFSSVEIDTTALN